MAPHLRPQVIDSLSKSEKQDSSRIGFSLEYALGDCSRTVFDLSHFHPLPTEVRMPSGVELKEGHTFQDATGLSVTVQEVVHDRVHFAVIDDGEAANTKNGEMSCLAFVRRFTKMGSLELASLEEDCARIKYLGYAASRHVRIYGEEYELLSDPFPQANLIAIRAKAKRDSSVRVITLPVTITQSVKRREYFPDCSICHKPVDLTTAKTDDNGHTVHENCYVVKLGLNWEKSLSGEYPLRAGRLVEENWSRKN
jgi:hypothetical protein